MTSFNSVKGEGLACGIPWVYIPYISDIGTPILREPGKRTLDGEEDSCSEEGNRIVQQEDASGSSCPKMDRRLAKDAYEALLRMERLLEPRQRLEWLKPNGWQLGMEEEEFIGRHPYHFNRAQEIAGRSRGLHFIVQYHVKALPDSITSSARILVDSLTTPSTGNPTTSTKLARHLSAEMYNLVSHFLCHSRVFDEWASYLQAANAGDIRSNEDVLNIPSSPFVRRLATVWKRYDTFKRGMTSIFGSSPALNTLPSYANPYTRRMWEDGPRAPRGYAVDNRLPNLEQLIVAQLKRRFHGREKIRECALLKDLSFPLKEFALFSMWSGLEHGGGVNLAGRSAAMTKSRFLQQQRLERQRREQNRKRNSAAAFIQRVYRGRREACQVAKELRSTVDKRNSDLSKAVRSLGLESSVLGKFLAKALPGQIQRLLFAHSIRSNKEDDLRISSDTAELVIHHYQLSVVRSGGCVSAFVDSYPQDLLPRFLSLLLDIDSSRSFDLALILPDGGLGEAVTDSKRLAVLAGGVWKEPSRSLKLIHDAKIGGVLALATLTQGMTANRDEPEFQAITTAAVHFLESVYPDVEAELSRYFPEPSDDTAQHLSQNLCRWIEDSATTGISSAVVRAVWWGSRSRGNSNDVLLSPHVMKALARHGDDEAIWALLGLYFGTQNSIALENDTRVLLASIPRIHEVIVRRFVEPYLVCPSATDNAKESLAQSCADKVLSGDELVYVGLSASATLYGTALQVMDADDMKRKDRNPVDPDILRSAIPVLNLVAFKLLSASAQPGCTQQLQTLVSGVCRICRSLHGRRSTLGLDSADYWVVRSSRPLLRAAADVRLADLAAEGGGGDEEMNDVDYMDEDNDVEGDSATQNAQSESQQQEPAVHYFFTPKSNGRSRSHEGEQRQLSAVLAELPHSIAFKDRVALFHTVLLNDHSGGERRHADLMFMMRSRRNETLQTVHRDPDLLLKDGMKMMENMSSSGSSHARWRVEWIDETGAMEPGIDGGGLFKEFLNLWTKEAFGKFFTSDENGGVYPIPNATPTVEELNQIRNLGRAVGKAVYELILVDTRFSIVFLNRILGLQFSIDEVATIDKEVCRSLLYLRHCSPEDVDALSLTFTVTAGNRDVELIPGGSKIPVTADNRMLYLLLMTKFKTCTQIEQQTKAFVEGIGDIIPVQWLQLFCPEELNMLISGEERRGFDVDDLQRHTEYSNGYFAEHPNIRAFWHVVRDLFTDADRDALLQFVTSNPRPPLLGFKTLSPLFAIARVDDPDRLPTASTCVNLLKLPDYGGNVEKLRKKLLTAIYAKAGFGLS
ncbi:hypothetical protein FOL47_004249 [Perkinsus chesapeaki]|uniref:HECT-type E3 ubiquitin transferase n=1 Tax=Perkinsus chesapeaki TaxID=330153 RepID=A0A7J6M3Y4_PERCH|nr:hypothetical protein FOL47_004249 [Perkinsus chesapeaki]